MLNQGFQFPQNTLAYLFPNIILSINESPMFYPPFLKRGILKYLEEISL